MKRQIFPKDILDNTFEVHQFSHSKRSVIIYTILLLLLLGILISLPLIKIDVYTSARGIIKSEQERVELIPAQSGKIIFSSLKNNLNVSKGDTLLIVENLIGEEKIKLISKQINEYQKFIIDIEKLLSSKVLKYKNLQTSRYLSEYNLFHQGFDERFLKYNQLKKSYLRDSTLYSKGVISKSEFEKITLEYDLSKNAIKQWKRQHRNKWEINLVEFKRTILELQSTEKQLQQSKSEYIVTAPLTGTLLISKGISENNFINAGQSIGEISPSGDLVVESYATPSDIGYLKVGMKTKFQIDAFNYNQWGMATGEIVEIGKDIELIDNTPVFKIRCQMEQQSLQLKNGFEGRLKKGMTLNARFFLAERTLFELLYDRIDDWLNPSKQT